MYKLVENIYNLRTLSENITFNCVSFKKRNDLLVSFSLPFRGEYKSILYFLTMYIHCVYTATSFMHHLLCLHAKTHYTNIWHFGWIFHLVFTARCMFDLCRLHFAPHKMQDTIRHYTSSRHIKQLFLCTPLYKQEMYWLHYK